MDMLEEFTSLTKQQQMVMMPGTEVCYGLIGDRYILCVLVDLQMNVVLVSSEHGFPYGLSRVNFNISNLTGVMYAGDIPPKDMFELLTGEWKMGSELAAAFMTQYGGHSKPPLRIMPCCHANACDLNH
jgi:hypothetical protein